MWIFSNILYLIYLHTHSKTYYLSVVILVSFYLPAGDLDLQSFDGDDDYKRLCKVEKF